MTITMTIEEDNQKEEDTRCGANVEDGKEEAAHRPSKEAVHTAYQSQRVDPVIHEVATIN